MICYDELLALRTKHGSSELDRAIKKYMRSRLTVDTPEKRKPITRAFKIKLYIQQDCKCARCKGMFGFSELTDDHTVALAQGGTNSKWNRRLVCAECNSSKGANDPVTESKLGHGTIIEQLGEEP